MDALDMDRSAVELIRIKAVALAGFANDLASELECHATCPVADAVQSAMDNLNQSADLASDAAADVPELLESQP